MLKRYFLDHKKRNFSTALIWIKGGSDMDSISKKGINKILSSILTRGCEGFDNFALSKYIESFGAELNQEVFEDGISISIKCLNEHFRNLYPLLELIINKPILSEIEFQKVKKTSIDFIKKEKENPFNICFDKWRKIVYSNHPYAFNPIGNENDVSKITHKDLICEFKNFKNREKYLISNNSEINGENLGTLEQNTINWKPEVINNDLGNNLGPMNRISCVNNNSNQTIILLGNKTCSRRSSEYLQLKILESYLSYGMSAALFKLFREKNGTPASPAIAFASSVLPVPGGPTNKTPLGILAPTEVNFSGFFRKVTTSCKSCLASFTPATSSKTTPVSASMANLAFVFPNCIACPGPPGIPFDLLANKIKPPIKIAGKSKLPKIPNAGGAVLTGCTSKLIPSFFKLFMSSGVKPGRSTLNLCTLLSKSESIVSITAFLPPSKMSTDVTLPELM